MEHYKITELKNYLKENNITKKEFAKRCGFSVQKLNYIIKNSNDYVKVSLCDLMTISQAMGVPYLNPKLLNTTTEEVKPYTLF